MCSDSLCKPTILRDLPCASLEQQANSTATRFDELNSPSVGHIPCGLPIYFNNLITNLQKRQNMSIISVWEQNQPKQTFNRMFS